MKILLISVGDNGGGTWFVADAINKYTNHEARSIRIIQSWLDYPFDIISPTNKELDHWLKWPDVIHIRDNAAKTWRIRKPTVVTYTGMSYRQRSCHRLSWCRKIGWIPTVSTIDLVTLNPKNAPEWIPNPREEMVSNERNKPFTVCHAPTFRDRKGTDVVIEACSKLGVKLELIEEKKYIDCLRIKSRCDILVDQFTYGYGNNAIEAWSFGIPVISGAEKQQYYDIVKEMNDGKLPYYACNYTVNDLCDAIDVFRSKTNVYHEYVERGRNYFFKYHHAPVVAKHVASIYERLLK